MYSFDREMLPIVIYCVAEEGEGKCDVGESGIKVREQVVEEGGRRWQEGKGRGGMGGLLIMCCGGGQKMGLR